MSEPQDHLDNGSGPRRLVTFDLLARHLVVSTRTARSWASQGYFPIYKMAGVRGALIDLDEAEAAIRRLPSTKVRPGFGSFGPLAVVKTLPAQAIVVEDDE